MSKEAMKLALSALQGDGWKNAGDAIRALEEALAEQQEPVAWMYPDDYDRMMTTETFCTVYSVKVGSAIKGESTVALYTSPLQRKPLTDGDIRHIANNAGLEPSEITGEVFYALRCVADEAAHNIKE